jgi:hypothetical protein
MRGNVAAQGGTPGHHHGFSANEIVCIFLQEINNLRMTIRN